MFAVRIGSRKVLNVRISTHAKVQGIENRNPLRRIPGGKN